MFWYVSLWCAYKHPRVLEMSSHFAIFRLGFSPNAQIWPKTIFPALPISHVVGSHRCLRIDMAQLPRSETNLRCGCSLHPVV